ncbi:NUDIX hydrolase [Nocardioides cynanchi]|uniref:NUDIX hydrolase n=1 Tax=Nocardioides cynanchi TaxID=2558918 RepID=UPI001245B322|nr:NUDIX hydrolase [Nocardioides cynanchi]
MAPTSSPGDVLAAGAVVLRKGRVLLVHRPAYDDWSFPKGKLDPGERPAVAAVREVGEETGLRVRLGVPLRRQSYPNGSRTKIVDFWVGRVLGDPDVSGYLVNSEIDEVAWVPVDKAAVKLTYRRDGGTLREALAVGKATRSLVVLRHGQARARKSWKPDDRLRPLVAEGQAQAQGVVPLLAAFGVSRIVSSSSRRCVDTVLPYAEGSGRPMTRTDGLSEEEADARAVKTVVADLVTSGEDAVLCTHRPVLPLVYESLGVEPINQSTGELVVVHHRRGRVRSVERHRG